MSTSAQVAVAAGDDTATAKPRGKKKLVLLLGVLLLMGGGGAALWFTNVLPHLLGRDKPPPVPAKVVAAPAIFVELPEMVANLNAGNRRAAFVKLQVRLEVPREEDKVLLSAAMPRLIDLFQTYLREMHPEELRGSAGTYRLREELLARVMVAAPSAQVTDVLFTQMIVQ